MYFKISFKDLLVSKNKVFLLPQAKMAARGGFRAPSLLFLNFKIVSFDLYHEPFY